MQLKLNTNMNKLLFFIKLEKMDLYLQRHDKI